MSTQKRFSIIAKLICATVIFGLVLVSCCIYHANIFLLLVFFFYIVVYDLIPGLFIVRLLNFRSESTSATLLVSFFAGWFLLILEYFLSQLMNSNIILYALGPIISISYILSIAKKKKLSMLLRNISLAAIPTSAFLFFALLMAYVFMFTQFQYLSPEFADNISVSYDKAYQMSLIGSLSHGYPLVDPLVAGRIVHYHIFSQILLAIPVILFGIAPDFLVMSCTPYLTTALMTLSMYALFRIFCNRKDRIGLYSLSFILSNVFIGRSISTSYIFRMILINENYAGFSAACLSACFILLNAFFRETRLSSKYSLLILITALTMLLTGIKAPLGLALVGALFGTFILGIILRRIPIKDSLLSTLLPTAGFFFVYRVLLSLNGTNGVGGESIFDFGNIIGVCFWKDDLTAFLKTLGVPTFFRFAIIFLIFLCFFFTAYTIPFIAGYLRELFLVIRGDKDYDFTKVAIYASAFVGFIAMMMLKYSGHSQVYFGIPTLLFAPLIVFWFFEDFTHSSKQKTQILFNVSRVWFFCILILTSVLLSLCFRDNYPSVLKHANPASSYNKYTSISSYEYEALKWIKENTPEDSLFATQMYKSNGSDNYSVANRWHHCHFLYAAYSVRNYYLEGSGYTFTDVEVEDRIEMIRNTDRLYDPSNYSRGKDARDLGIDYVIVTKKIYDTPNLEYDEFKIVFDNKDVTIYEVV